MFFIYKNNVLVNDQPLPLPPTTTAGYRLEHAGSLPTTTYINVRPQCRKNRKRKERVRDREEEISIGRNIDRKKQMEIETEQFNDNNAPVATVKETDGD